MKARHPADHPLVRLLPAVDLALLALAFTASYAMRFGRLPFRGPQDHVSSHLALALAVLAGWVPAFFLLDLYDPARFGARRSLLSRLARAAVLVAILGSALLFLLQAKLASRLVFASTIAIGCLAALGSRMVLHRVLARRGAGQRVVVLGAGAEAARVAATLEGVDVVGFLGDGETAVDPALVLGPAQALPAVLDARVVDHVVVALPPGAWSRVDEALAACAEVGVGISIAAPLSGDVLARAVPDRLFAIPVLRLHGSPQFRAAMAGKRVFDVVAAVLLLVPALPVVAVAALVVRLTSPGPSFFIQERVGLNGRRFRLYKLRTMVHGAGPFPPVREPKPRRDPRVTPLGRLLRRFSVDEIPQLWNVLKGDMSLVGPRPPLPEEVARYDRHERRRLSMRPGLTGPWQVSGRADLGFDEWMRLDLEYVDGWSPWLDLKVLFRTVPAVLGGRGAR